MSPGLLSSANRQGPIFSFDVSPVISGVPRTFGELLRSEIDRLGVEYSDFAKRVGVSPSHLSDLMEDRRSLNSLKFQAFADALGLRDTARQRFIDMAVTRHLKPDLRSYFYAMIERFEKSGEK